MKTVLIIVAISCLCFHANESAAYELDFKDFASSGFFEYPFGISDDDGICNQNKEAVDFIFMASLWKKSGQELYKNQPGNLDDVKCSLAKDAIEQWIESEVLPEPSSWPISGAQLAAVVAGKEFPPVAKKPSPKPKSLLGFKSKGIKIREKLGDWAKSYSKSSGASISFIDDNESDRQTASGKGALVFPLVRAADSEGEDDINITYLPAIEWDITDVSGGTDSDTEELKFSGGLSMELGFEGPISTLIWNVTPFYLTDLDFDGEIIGIETGVIPYLQINNFELNSYRALIGEAAYRLGFEPKLQYSRVLTGSEFITRDEDNTEFSIGVDIEFALKPFGGDTGWEFIAGYSVLEDLENDNETAELWDFKSLFWINKNFAISGLYEDGDAPITRTAKDQFTLGLEYRY